MRCFREELDIKCILSAWEQIDNDEKMFFYNPHSERKILAWSRNNNNTKDGMPYFSTIRFNENKNSCKWDKFISQEIRFCNAIITDNTGTVLYGDSYIPRMVGNTFEVIKHRYKIEGSNYSTWTEMFRNIKRSIDAGNVRKVVASREILVRSEQIFSITSILSNLLEANKKSFVFAYQNNGRVFLGATPEILVMKEGKRITSYAVAGTMKKCQEDKGNRLLEDPKNNEEHKIVVDYIADIMRKNGKNIQVGNTELLALKNLYHLKTEINVENTTLNLVDWAKLLHPTPAMCGFPKGEAMNLINKFEKHDRGLFAAPIGIIEKNGDGIFVVGIRSALIDRNKLYAYAGCGIVKQSDCREEYEETNTKLRTILEAL